MRVDEQLHLDYFLTAVYISIFFIELMEVNMAGKDYSR